MPTYEYQCGKCGETLEIFQKITDPPRKRCPKCRGALRRKLGTGAGVLFKGSGFYATDYRSESYKKAASAEKSETKTDSAKSSTGGAGATAASKKSD